MFLNLKFLNYFKNIPPFPTTFSLLLGDMLPRIQVLLFALILYIRFGPCLSIESIFFPFFAFVKLFNGLTMRSLFLQPRNHFKANQIKLQLRNMTNILKAWLVLEVLRVPPSMLSLRTSSLKSRHFHSMTRYNWQSHVWNQRLRRTRCVTKAKQRPTCPSWPCWVSPLLYFSNLESLYYTSVWKSSRKFTFPLLAPILTAISFSTGLPATAFQREFSVK